MSAIPTLEPGDRLTRDKFERRYAAMPALKKKAELIAGVVYMPSSVRVRRHGGPHAKIITWLGHYEAKTPSAEVADNATARLDLDNEPQPDAMLYIAPELGGQVRITPDDYVEAAPELVTEVASSSASYDLNTKLDAYRRNGVQEYLVWSVLDQQIDWFLLRSGRYERLEADDGGVSAWKHPGSRIRQNSGRGRHPRSRERAHLTGRDEGLVQVAPLLELAPH